MEREEKEREREARVRGSACACCRVGACCAWVRQVGTWAISSSGGGAAD
jgi:hypothetical protein